MKRGFWEVCCVLALTAGSVLAGCGEKKDMSMKMNEPRNIRGVVSYRRSFGDLNDVQLKSAKAIGIRPIASREEARNLGRPAGRDRSV